jgi:hypothetical protein
VPFPTVYTIPIWEIHNIAPGDLIDLNNPDAYSVVLMTAHVYDGGSLGFSVQLRDQTNNCVVWAAGANSVYLDGSPRVLDTELRLALSREDGMPGLYQLLNSGFDTVDVAFFGYLLEGPPPVNTPLTAY